MTLPSNFTMHPLAIVVCHLLLLLLATTTTTAFVIPGFPSFKSARAFPPCGLSSLSLPVATTPTTTTPTTTTPTKTSLSLFGKVFEESGPLGKGITVGKVQIALNCPSRNSDSILGVVEQKASANISNSNAQLARLSNNICLALLRKSNDWTAACSESQWFSQKDASRAESLFNDWSTKEAAKFEKEYIPGSKANNNDDDAKGGGATVAVVSLVVEIQGDDTKLDSAGYSLSGTKEVLSSLAADCLVDGGDCVNAVEVFWCPGERTEVLTSRDIILDFPELIDL